MKVICIENFNGHKYQFELPLTIGKCYDVEIPSVADYCYYYFDDNGTYCVGPKKWFIPLNDIRQAKLERIINEI
jgi:hypothetical protein